MIVNEDIIYFKIDEFSKIGDLSDTFSFIFSYKTMNLKFRKECEEKYSFNNINVNPEVNYYITTTVDMKIKNYKVNIEGQVENKKNDIKNDVFRNGNNRCKVTISEISPDAEFTEYNLMNKETVYNGILEYNNNQNNNDRKGKYDNKENSLIEVKNNGNLCILRREYIIIIIIIGIKMKVHYNLTNIALIYQIFIWDIMIIE